MDDNTKQASSYQVDQEILDEGWKELGETFAQQWDNIARGIGMTVEEVAGLSTCKYAERVQALRLSDHDLAFLKGLRRRIKNRLASQNSRRRSMEHLRRLTRELRIVRAKRDSALAARRDLVLQRDTARYRCQMLRKHIVQVLQSRCDTTEVPSIDLDRTTESQNQTLKDNLKKVIVTETKTPLLAECFIDNKIERDKSIFECRIDKIVQSSVNHIFKSEKDRDRNEKDKKKVFAKTVFISNDRLHSSVKSMVVSESNLEVDVKSIDSAEEGGVLNLSVKQEKRKIHGRKQSAPRRIPYAFMDSVDNDDGVLDLKIKKEPQ